jgi:hypothetical protein
MKNKPSSGRRWKLWEQTQFAESQLCQTEGEKLQTHYLTVILRERFCDYPHFPNKELILREEEPFAQSNMGLQEEQDLNLGLLYS